jgi:DNA-binding CsgD family transcriptional regulator
VTALTIGAVFDGPYSGLDQAILSITTPAFDEAIIRSLRLAGRADHCFIAMIAPNSRPECLFIGGTIGPELIRDMVQAYVGDFYRADPNIQEIEGCQGPTVGMLLPLKFKEGYTRLYHDRFFGPAGVTDKFATAIKLADRWFYSNFYRLGRHERFSDPDIARIMTVAPLFTAAITRHLELKERERESARGQLELPALLECAPPFDRLTSRERAVCLHILGGYTSEAIGLRLEISLNSILSYRKRAYAKLGITSASQLFSLVLVAQHRRPQ